MRLIMFLTMLLFTSIAFAGDKTTINDQISVSKALMPDIMSSSVSVSSSSASFKTTTAQMEKLASIIKSHSDTCSFTGYNVAPMYRYDNKNRVLDGYQGFLTSPCKFTSTAKFDSLLNDVYSLTMKNGVYDISMSAISWVSEPAKIEAIIKTLKLELVTKAMSKAKDFSSVTSMNCSLDTITYQDANNISFQPALRMAKAETSVPDKQAQDITVNANYSLICQ